LEIKISKEKPPRFSKIMFFSLRPVHTK